MIANALLGVHTFELKISTLNFRSDDRGVSLGFVLIAPRFWQALTVLRILKLLVLNFHISWRAIKVFSSKDYENLNFPGKYLVYADTNERYLAV